MYPSLLRECNISKESKLCTVTEIEGIPSHLIEDIFECASDPVANAVYICSRYFNLPDYKELLQLTESET